MQIRDLLNKLNSIETKQISEAIDLQTIQAAVAGKNEQARAAILQQMAEKEGLPGLYDPESGYFVSSRLESNGGEIGGMKPRISATASKSDDAKLASLGLISKNSNTSTALGRLFGQSDDKYVNDLRTTSDNVVAKQASDKKNAENLKKLIDILQKLSTMVPNPKTVSAIKESIKTRQQLGSQFGPLLVNVVEWYDNRANLSESRSYKNTLAGLGWTPEYANADFPVILREDNGQGIIIFTADDLGIETTSNYISENIAEQLIESFGFNLSEDGEVYDKNGNYIKGTGTSGQVPSTKVNPPPKQTPALSAPKPTSALSLPAAAAAANEPSMLSKMWGGAKGIFKKAALPVTMAVEIYDAIQDIKKIPATASQTEKHAAVVKIVAHLVNTYGLFWVGSIAGGIIAGAISGPGAVAGFVAGGIGGMAASYLLGDSVNAITDKIVDWAFGTSPSAQSGAQAKWPTTPEEIKAFQQSHKDKNGKPLVVDGIIGSLTYQALIAAGAKPPAGFTVTPYKTNKPQQGGKPEEPKVTPYDLKNDPVASDLIKQANELIAQLSDAAKTDPAIGQTLRQAQEIISKFGPAPTVSNATADTTKGPNMGQVNTPTAQQGAKKEMDPAAKMKARNDWEISNPLKPLPPELK